MTQLVAQSVINQFFDGTHSDPFAVLGMHETDNGIEIRALLPDANRVPVWRRKHEISLFINCKCIGATNHKLSRIRIVITQ